MAFMMTRVRMDSTQPSLEHSLTRVRWGPLNRTVMDYTTWLGMWKSGVGIGTLHGTLRMRPAALIWEEPIHAAPPQARTGTVWCEAVVGRCQVMTSSAPLRTLLTRPQSAP